MRSCSKSHRQAIALLFFLMAVAHRKPYLLLHGRGGGPNSCGGGQRAPLSAPCSASKDGSRCTLDGARPGHAAQGRTSSRMRLADGGMRPGTGRAEVMARRSQRSSRAGREEEEAADRWRRTPPPSPARVPAFMSPPSTPSRAPPKCGWSSVMEGHVQISSSGQDCKFDPL